MNATPRNVSPSPSYTALAYAIFIPHRWVVNGTCDKIIDRVADEDDDLVFTEVKKKLVVDVRAKDDLELYYKTIPDYFEQDDGRKLTEIPDRTSTDMIEGTY